MAASSLETLVRTAVDASGAAAGWLVALTPGGLRIHAYCGPHDPARFLGATFPFADAGTVGLAAGSGQPMAVRPRSGDPQLTKGPMSLLEQPPTSYLTLPCADDDGVTGVLEVVDKQSAAGFDIDDVELLSLLSDIAAAILREQAQAEPPGPSPLARLATRQPRVYAALTTLIETLDIDR